MIIVKTNIVGFYQVMKLFDNNNLYFIDLNSFGDHNILHIVQALPRN